MAKTYFSAIRNSLLALLVSTSVLSAQSPSERRANRLFENFAYEPAIELYESVIKKNPENKAVIRNLAESYRKTNNSIKTEQWLARVIESGIARNEDYLYYAQALETNGKKEEARKQFEKYDGLMAADKRGERSVQSLARYENLFVESDNYRIENLGSNTVESDFSPAFYNNGLIHVSARSNTAYIKSVFPWNNRRWLDLHFIELLNDSLTGSVTLLPSSINTKYHEGPVSWSASRNELAFTRNNYFNGKVRRSSDHINKLKIFFSSPKGNNKWSSPVSFIHNSDEYSTGHPVFGTDGKTLYFASDMPGGYGGTDLYVSRFENNTWSKPENLGPTVNTEGNEFFPFVLNDSILFFASNGWGGLGGLDILKSELKDGKAGQAANVGAPVNSPRDDFGLIMKPDGRSGYFSSNRIDGKGDDDIYRFTYTPSLSAILVIDQDEVKPVTGAQITLQQAEQSGERQLVSDGEGKATTLLRGCQQYNLTIKAEGYPERRQSVQTACPAKPGEEIRILIRKPKVYGNVFDKYLNKDIAGAKVTLTDVTGGEKKEAGTAVTDEKGYFKFVLLPCHEYHVSALKEGLPEVSRTFKAPCTDKEEDAVVRLGTGIAPQRGVLLQLFVTDEQSGSPVGNAKLQLLNKSSGELMELIADDNGSYETVLKEGVTYTVNASRIGYFSTSKSKSNIPVAKGERKIIRELSLLKLREGGQFALEGVFYDLAKFNIRPDAARVLDYVVQVMQENPSMVIELGSHTDAQGGDADNLILSEKRAKAAEEYIVSKGIDAARITGKGYGETQLKNNCGNGVKCPDKLHQENRRTEIRIVNFE